MEELVLGQSEAAFKVAFHKHWLGKIKNSLLGISYVSHVRRPSQNYFGIKIILDGNALEFPLSGNPNEMIDENYKDFIMELQNVYGGKG